MKPFFLFFLGAFLGSAVAEPADPASAVMLRAIFETRPGPGARAEVPGKLDALVEARLKQKGLEPAPLCSDAVFLRRACLDVIGTLPTADEARRFLDDPDPAKRPKLIEALLARDEFADYWGMKWGEVLRVKSEFPINLWPNAAQAYDRWIRTALRQNMPYTRFAWELLTASGSNFRSPQVNFYRAAGGHDPKTLARAVALTFMGERADQWPQAKLAGMAAFFSRVGFKATGEWKEEIVYFSGLAESAESAAPKEKAFFPDGTPAALPPDRDPREVFATWLLSSKNSPFARAAVNRVWFWLMGRGIVQEPDDMRADNPPGNPELLDFLAQQLAANRYDLKAIYRLILNSRAYQRSCLAASSKPEAAAAFAAYPLRRVEAEVLIDAINQITGSRDEYSSMTPEPFTWVPGDKRTLTLPDGSISSAFLDLFGRPPRDSGLLTERNNRPTAAQRLHLINSGHIQSKLNKSDKLRALFAAHPNLRDGARELYLTILSRYPDEAELSELNAYSATSESKGQQVLYDLAWALINSTEFLYRH